MGRKRNLMYDDYKQLLLVCQWFRQNNTKEDKLMEGKADFQKIMDAAKITGLSPYFIRKGCKAGEIPHIRSGLTYYVNVPALLQKLDAESRK